jgi:hypothetical protein
MLDLIGDEDQKGEIMESGNLPPALQKLAMIGAPKESEPWLDYSKLGISIDQVPALIELLHHIEDYWEEWEEDDPQMWLPLHAWRALAKLHALNALPVLLELLDLIEPLDSDLIQEELPQVFQEIGPAAIPALIQTIRQPQHSHWARITALEGLRKIGLQSPEVRSEVVNAIVQIFAEHSIEDVLWNSSLVLNLALLKAVEAAPWVEQIFRSGQIDQNIAGDWEDFQIAVGLRKKRLTQSPRQVISDTQEEWSDPARSWRKPKKKKVKLAKKKHKKEKKAKK